MAVAIEIIEDAKQGKTINSITLIEKGKSIGPGLAYSDACSGTILNMHLDTIGLFVLDRTHFSRWRSTHALGSKKRAFPSRPIYGQYLLSLMEKAVEDAEQLRITPRVIHGEATDLQSTGKHLGLSLADNTKLQACSVVLALGNLHTPIYPDLLGAISLAESGHVGQSILALEAASNRKFRVRLSLSPIVTRTLRSRGRSKDRVKGLLQPL